MSPALLPHQPLNEPKRLRNLFKGGALRGVWLLVDTVHCYSGSLRILNISICRYLCLCERERLVWPGAGRTRGVHRGRKVWRQGVPDATRNPAGRKQISWLCVLPTRDVNSHVSLSVKDGLASDSGNTPGVICGYFLSCVTKGGARVCGPGFWD